VSDVAGGQEHGVSEFDRHATWEDNESGFHWMPRVRLPDMY